MSEIKKIAIIGPESTGKTFLAVKLAAYYKCFWVPEFAREYLNNLKRGYTRNDVEIIAKGQLEYEVALKLESKKILISDTDLLVIKIWMQHKYDDCPAWIEKHIMNNPYDLYLLCKPDIPYEHDPLRENPELGDYFFNNFQVQLNIYGFPYVIISGNYEERLQEAIKAINQLN